MKPVAAKTVALIAYAATAALSTLAAVLLLQLWQADLRVPFDYGGDALLFGFIVKTVVDYGWCWSNPSAGAPATLHLQDYAVSAHDSFHLLLIRAMSLFSGDWALIFNVYFLLGFPLIALSAMAAFRRFRVGYVPAMVGGVLYAFLPSRLLKGEGHLFLDVFFQVPLAALLLLWVSSEEPPFFKKTADSPRARWPRFDLRRRRSVTSILLGGLIASTSAYYAFFTICLLLGAGACSSVRRRSMGNVLSGLALGGVIALGLAANGLPTLLYQARHGPNAEIGTRHSWDAEIYGLKVAQLLLPVAGHRTPALARLKHEYDRTAPLNGESGTTSLGMVGGVGFLLLVGTLLSSGRRSRLPADGTDDSLSSPWHALAMLTVFGVLLGTIGGFGSLIAFLASPQIRTYSRLNVFIGFFSIFAVVILLDRLRARRPRLAVAVSLVVLELGLLDQGSLYAIRPYGPTKETYASDRALVNRIEGTLPPGSAVFELPFSPFPEPPDLHGMTGYGPLRGYLHAQKRSATAGLRWSYPAMRGRGVADWVRDAAEREPAAMLERVSDGGFDGLLIDRDGYADRAVAIESALRRLLGAEPLVSARNNLSFFSLLDYNLRRHRGESAPDRERREYRASHPIEVTWGKGFWGIEREPTRSFRWSGAASELRIENDSPLVRRLSLTMTLAAARPPAHLTIDGDLLSERLVLTDPGVWFERTVDVPPGGHRLRFTCDGRRADAPADPRVLIWSLENFVQSELVSPP